MNEMVGHAAGADLQSVPLTANLKQLSKFAELQTVGNTLMINKFGTDCKSAPAIETLQTPPFPVFRMQKFISFRQIRETELLRIPFKHHST
jgi:hypothetical protein